MSRCCVVLTVLLALPNISGAPLLDACSSEVSAPLQAKDTIDAWARENYDLVLDMVLQDHCRPAKEVRWISCIRILPAYHDEIEYSLSVERRYDGTVFGQIARPKGQSIYTQFCKQRKEHPRASLADLARLIELESQAGDQRRFPGLVRLADEFEKVRFSPILSDEIMMDPTEYRLHVRSFSGENMLLTLDGPGAAAAVQPAGLIRWAESAREMLAGAFH